MSEQKFQLDRAGKPLKGFEKGQFALGISPVAYNLLCIEKSKNRQNGQIVTRRELADKAIIAAYGSGNGEPKREGAL